MTEHSRRAEYIDAASRLFLVKGYKGTSVRDILSAVGDSSPSVFYYYFSSKESIYRAVIESLAVRYIERIDAILFKEQKPLDMLKDFLATFMDVLSNGRTIDAEDPESHLFYLHLQEQVTMRYIEVWKRCIIYLKPDRKDSEDIDAMARFLAGGSGQLITGLPDRSPESLTMFIHRFARLCGNTLQLDDEKRAEYEKMMMDMLKGCIRHRKEEEQNIW